MQPAISGKTLQRHRLFGSKECVAAAYVPFPCLFLPRHKVLAAKRCVADMQPVISGKILQRHRVFDSKECVADWMDRVDGLSVMTLTMTLTTDHSASTKHDFAVLD